MRIELSNKAYVNMMSKQIQRDTITHTTSEDRQVMGISLPFKKCERYSRVMFVPVYHKF